MSNFIQDIHTVAVEAPKLVKALGADEAEDKQLAPLLVAATAKLQELIDLLGGDSSDLQATIDALTARMKAKNDQLSSVVSQSPQ